MLAALAAILIPAATPDDAPLVDKTLVAWVAPANLDQRGGSVLTIDDGDSHFDAIVLGELAPARWMAGSDGFARTPRNQDAYPPETVGPDGLVQLAIVYRGDEVTVYRDGAIYSRHRIARPQPFRPDSLVLIGPRHLGNGDHFAGSIADARIYDHALTREEIASLMPDDPAGPPPWAWWTFDDPSALDRTGRYPASWLHDGARVEGGRLLLDGKKAALFAARSEAHLDALKPRPKPPSIAQAPHLPDDIAIVRRFRNHLLADPFRPTYHFVIPEDYAMPFDPNGAIFWRGRYHLFYIYQEGTAPGPAARRDHCFGHVSSVDLLHWRQHPTSLYPTDVSADRGMFSGNCFVTKDGKAAMLFHGVGAGNCIMTSDDDDLDLWTRLPSNPIIPIPGPDVPYTSWDPHGWLEGDTYYAIFGGIPGANPKPASVFKADRLDAWTHVGPFLHHDMPGVGPEEDISCPDFFTLGGKRVLVCIAHNRGTRYYVGDWKNEQFHPEVHERMSWVDNTYFAPETLLAPDGRRILWAWIFDQRRDDVRRNSGWSGEYALPRELTLGPDLRLRMRPLAELKSLRYDERSLADVALPDGAEVLLEPPPRNVYELELTIDPGTARRVGLRVARSPDRAEETAILLDLDAQALQVDTRNASLDQGVKVVESAPLAIQADQPVTLRVFLDRSVVEVFADDRQAVTRRIYPSRPDSTGLALFAEGGAAHVRGIRAWRLAASNPD